MITAVDSNVVIDILIADARHGEASRRALARVRQRGSTIASDVVWAEVAARFPSIDAASVALDRLGIEFRPLTAAASAEAGAAWRAYRARGGRRDRIIADFLIGAHAALGADQLLTRDRGFYRTYFRRLRIVAPDGSA